MLWCIMVHIKACDRFQTARSGRCGALVKGGSKMGIVPPQIFPFQALPCLSTASVISTSNLFQRGQFAPGFSLAHSEGPCAPARPCPPVLPWRSAAGSGCQSCARAASEVHSRAVALPTSLPPSLCPSPRQGWGPGEPGPPSWPPAATAPARRPCPASLRRSSESYPRCRSLSSRPLPQAFPLPNRGFLIRKRVQRLPE